MLDPEGEPVKRNFVHVDDLVERDPRRASTTRKPASRPSTSAWTSRSTTASSAHYLAEDARAADACRSGRPYHSTWLDNTKAKFLLGWRPQYDLARMTDAAFDYQRAPDDPRKVWYPGERAWERG